MNTVHSAHAAPTTPSASPTSFAVVLRFAPFERRERDFGTGYGRSSGYASERRYTNHAVPPRFRVA